MSPQLRCAARSPGVLRAGALGVRERGNDQDVPVALQGSQPSAHRLWHLHSHTTSNDQGDSMSPFAAGHGPRLCHVLILRAAFQTLI